MPANDATGAGRLARLADAIPPIMPDTASRLQQLLGAANTRHAALQEVILGDPAAAIALFRRLAQASPGAQEQVADAAHAVSLLGLNHVRGLLEQLPRVEPGTADRRRAGPQAAYSQAAHAAFYADRLADHARVGGGDLSTAALLQNPAILALWATEPESAHRATNALREGVPVCVAFGAELGAPLDNANRRLAETWAFPRLARDAIDNADGANPRTMVVRLADDLSQSTAAGWHHDDHQAVLERLADFLGLEPATARGWLHRLATEAARHLQPTGYPLPGFELLYIPAQADEEDDGDIPEMRSYSPVTTAAARPPDLHEAMADIMRRMRRDAGTERVVFAILSRDRQRLRTRLALGVGQDDGLRELDLELAQMNLFTALMGKPQSVWLNAGNAHKYSAYLPQDLRTMLRTEGAYLMSLFAGDRPLGLLYGDGPALDQPGYQRFRRLCNEAASALGGIASAVPATPGAAPSTA